MRILHTTQYFMPWMGYQEPYLALEQIRMGHDVRVLASNLRWPLDPWYQAHGDGAADREMQVGDSVEHGIPATRLRVLAAPMSRLVLHGVGRAIAAFRPDVVHAHGYLVPLTFQVALAKRARPFRLLVDEHQLPYQARHDRLHRLQRRGMAMAARRWLLPSADHLVAVAEGARQWLVEEYGCPAERVHFIPLGADPAVFHPDAASGAALRTELGLAADGSVVVSSGKIAPHKRIDVLVNAIGALPADRRPSLVLIGNAEPATLAALQELARQRSVRLLVAPAAPHERLRAFYNAADVCVWPADCTISHIEAAACGAPIVIPDEPGIADRIAGDNGIGVPVGDAAALARALEALFADGALRRRMGEAGRAHILRHYTWAAIAQRFVDLYQSDRGTIPVAA
ncbi:MAG: glycosyltransferase family 4 protein [Myxococcales bacterium]|nr:glycosyltransferase family 4 protein [Myxococcales bacterium]